MKKNSLRQQRKYAKRKSSARNLIIGGVALLVLAVVVFFVLKSSYANAAGASAGPVGAEEVIPVNSRDHIPEGTDPGPYPSDPPAGGHHFPVTFPAKFYQESDVASLPAYPQGYLVHDLEHGYVIFWYNCQLLDAAGCTTLKGQIKGIMDSFDGVKVIAFPWTSINVPVVMTSWGKLERFPTFDVTLATSFVRRNRYQAPEPTAQ